MIHALVLFTGLFATSPMAPQLASAHAFESVGSELWQFELRRTRLPEIQDAAQLVLQRVDGSGEALDAQASRVLLAEPWGHPAFEPRLDHASLAHGAWVLAGTIHGGAQRAIPLWFGDADASAGGAVARGYLQKVAVEVGDDPSARSRIVLADLHAPSVFAWRGRLHVAASGMGPDRPRLHGRERVWTAPLPEPGDVDAIARLAGAELDAWSVGDGIDARVVVVGDEVYVGVRAARSYPESVGDAALHVYRSRDLVTWRKDEGLSTGTLVRPGYDLAWHADRLWLATPVAGEHASVEVRRFESGPQRWERVQSGARFDVSSADRPLWLVGDGASPLVVASGTEGRWIRRAP